MKASRKKVARRRPVRRAAPLTLTQRVERLEKSLLFKPKAAPSTPAAPSSAAGERNEHGT